jgi:hypothetical protein
VLIYYNFCKLHKAHRPTPAVAAGVTDRLWDPTRGRWFPSSPPGTSATGHLLSNPEACPIAGFDRNLNGADAAPRFCLPP